MRKNLLLIIISFVLIPFGVIAQDTIPDLIISEARLDAHPNAYFEICNVGDSALNLDQFLIQDPQGAGDVMYFKEGILLEPNQTYVVSNIYEEPGQSWEEVNDVSDQLVYQWEFGDLFDKGILVDSLSPGYPALRPFGGKYGIVLWYKSSDLDSMVIDCFNWNKDESGNTYKETGGLPIAGVVEPVLTNTAIRKSSINQGNLGNWDASRGTDASDADWILTEHLNPGLPFTTVGHHGASSIDVTSDNSAITVDLTNGTLTVPWGIYKGDSLVKELNFGDGMAWWYIEAPVFEDSIHNIVQTGDILQVKSFGTELTIQDLTITVSAPSENMNLVFPRRNINRPGEEDPPGTITTIGGTRYYVTENMPVLDTIGDVPFATRVDTMFSYIEWASNASAEIIWKDGTERVDLVNGDILEVTAANGDKKQYYIDVQEYVKSDNVMLSAITWPDITTEDNWDFSWTSDTVPEFQPNVYQYNITLKYGSTHVPALKAHTEDLNARVVITPAVSLKGGNEERTTVFKVISESDTLEQEYSVTFSVYQPPENQQKFFGEPFFSEFHTKFSTFMEWFEIANPGNQPLDLSKYLIVGGKSVSPAEAVQQSLDSANRYMMYAPGYRWSDNATAWDNEDYKVLKYDGSVDPIVEPNGGVFVVASRKTHKAEDKFGITSDWYNVSFPDDGPNIWGLTFGTNEAMPTRNKEMVLYMFRIDNDTVLNGNKPIGDMNDLTLVDVIGYPDGTEFGDIGGYDWDGGKGHKLVRKPSIWRGNSSYYESAGTSPEDCEWTWSNAPAEGIDWMEHISTIGSHVLDPVTAYMSTVSSLVYLVDDGYEGDLGITGISNGETVEQFIANLILPDTGQIQVVKTGTEGTFLDPTDVVSTGDTLVVTSADEKTTTKYHLDITPLDGNTALVAAEGSDLTIGDGTVSGFSPGTTLEDVLAGVEAASEFSILNIKDASGALVPLQMIDFEGNYLPVKATSETFIEVVAQNGDRALYQLTPDSEAGDAFVLSSIYEVDQDYFIISRIPGGTAVSTFMASITPAEGATVTIIDKADFDRSLGNLAYDDILKVVSSDGANTVYYMLNFIEEIIINTEPSVTVSTANIEAEAGVAISVSASAEDDGLPAPPAELSYSWTVSSGNASDVTIANPDQPTTDVTFDVEGSYTLQVAVNDGELESVATINVSVITGITNKRSAFRMYPNPANASVFLEFVNRGNEIPGVSIINITGKTVYKGMAESNTMRINLSNLESGLYFVKIENGGETSIRKLSVVK